MPVTSRHLVRLAVTVLLALDGKARAQAPGDFYGSTHAGGAVVAIDQQTGADVLVGAPTGGGDTLPGLDFDSTGRLFGTTLAGSASALVRIDPDTGLSLGTIGTVADGGQTLALSDVAFQPGTDVLFGLAVSRQTPGVVPDHRLYRIDTATAAATLVGDPGFSHSGGLAFGPDGTLWATEPDPAPGQNRLVTLDPSTGAVLTSVVADRLLDGLGARVDGTLFGTTEGASTELVTVAPDGSTTLVGTGTADVADVCFRPFGIDRFQCYQARETKGAPRFIPALVSLTDQFETVPASTISRPRTLCNPVATTPALGLQPGLVDPARHQICYRMQDERGPIGKFQRRSVLVINRFGIQQVTVAKPLQLCTPAEKGHVPDPPVPADAPGDAYRCYKAKLVPGSPDPSGTALGLSDQFGVSSSTMRRAFRFCNPVGIDGEDIVRPRAHLMCYGLFTVPTPAPDVQVNTDDVFGPLAMTARTLASRYLCVPSYKFELAPE
jgi:hypothetical protein